MRNSWSINFIWHSTTRLLEQISWKAWQNCRRVESGFERGGIGSVIELALAKQVYKGWWYYDSPSWSLAEVLTVLTWRPLLKIILGYFLPVTRPIINCCLWSFVYPLFCSLMPNMKVLSFWFEIFKRLLGETHVFWRTFIFFIFVCNGEALNLIRHVVDLSESLTMSRQVETTKKLSMSRNDFLILVLQISNGFDMNSLFFEFYFFNLFLPVYGGHTQ